MLNKPLVILGISTLLTLVLSSIGIAVRFFDPALSKELSPNDSLMLVKTVFLFFTIGLLLYLSIRDERGSMGKLFFRNSLLSAISGVMLLIVFKLVDSNNFILGRDIFIISINYLVLLGIVQLVVAYIRSYQMKYQTQLNLEKIEKEKLSIELNALKGQLNPHFLFNALNTLNGLIRIDQEKAIRFSEQISELFRYILQNRDVLLTSLKNEIKFSEEYLELYKTRYGENLTYDINVPNSLLNTDIPSLSLQLLIENAIKHNDISRHNPLLIEIKNEGSKLIIQNNINPKRQSVRSTGVGLANLNKRFQLLLNQDIQITNKEGTFKVILHLKN